MSELPAGWRSGCLGDVIDGFEAGRNLKAHGRPAEGDEFGVLKVSAVSWGEFDASENKALLNGDKPKPKELVRKGDVLISRANTTELVGSVVHVRDDYDRLMLPDKVLRIRYRSDAIDPEFLVYSLRQRTVREFFEANATGTSDSMRNLAQPKIEAAPLTIPPLGEQRRIVARLRDLRARSSAARDALGAVPGLLEKLRQSILAAAFRGDLTKDWRAKNADVEPASELLKRIRIERRRKWEQATLEKLVARDRGPANERWKQKYSDATPSAEPWAAPSGWVWTTMDALTTTITSGSRGWAEYYSETGPLFIRSQDISSDCLDISTAAHVAPPAQSEGSRTRVQRADLLVTITGANVTRAARVETDIDEAYVSQHVGLLRPVDSATSDWLHLWLISEAGGRKFLKAAAYGLGKPGLGLADLGRLPVLLPPRAEQDLIAARTLQRQQPLASLADRHMACSNSLLQLDAALLARAFTGSLLAR